MKIEMNTIYHLPTQAHEDDFLKQAEKQGLTWDYGQEATSESYWNNGEYCIRTKERYLAGHDSKSPYERTFPNLPIIEWKISLTKADMQIGQTYLQANGNTYRWNESDNLHYLEDLTFKTNNHDYDIAEVYEITPIWKREEPKAEVYEITPIWKRPEPKYRVKTELTKEQAEKLGLEFCEVVE